MAFSDVEVRPAERPLPPKIAHMSVVSARRLIVAYSALLALMDLAVLLPGRLDYTSGWGFIGSVAIQALIVWRLWHGSTLAWFSRWPSPR
jgi:hypothetical protein